jgi:hypothetical protein
VILVGTTATLEAHRTTLSHNVANHLIRAIGDNDVGLGYIALDDCLVADNDVAPELIRISGDDVPLEIDQCSIVHDIINSTHLIKFDNTGGTTLTLSDSIIDEARARLSGRRERQSGHRRELHLVERRQHLAR